MMYPHSLFLLVVHLHRFDHVVLRKFGDIRVADDVAFCVPQRFFW
jgi:hypothetical protein